MDCGATLGGQDSNGAVCEFMPRFFAFCEGSSEAEDILESLSSLEAEEALANYVESYRDTQPGAQDHWWNEQADLFGQGGAAMMILYPGHVSSRMEERVFESILGGAPAVCGELTPAEALVLAKKSPEQPYQPRLIPLFPVAHPLPWKLPGVLSVLRAGAE